MTSQVCNLVRQYSARQHAPTTILLIDFSLTEKAATLIFIFVRGSAISCAKQWISGSFYNFVKN